MNPATPTWDCTEARPSLGVYVLGAIDPAERTLVDHHLATCRDCRDELAGLAGLPALLARVNPDEVSRIRADDTVRTATEDRPPDELLGTVLDLAEARRRRTRWRFLATAAAVVVLAGGLFGGLRAATSTTHTVYAAQYPTGTGRWDSVQATSKITGASATINYASELWGRTFEVLVTGIPAGTTCDLWVVHPDGTRTEVAAWTTSHDEGRVWYPGSMSDSTKPISAFQITADSRVLLTATPT
jgi:predicted anti-sigma-YlaC factor YlaD